MKKTIILFGLLTLLTGCHFSTEKTSSETVQSVEFLQNIRKSATVQLSQETISPEKIKIKIMLENPEQKEIISARTWLAYDPAVLNAIEIDTTNSDFDLFAPGENNIDATAGVIKIGRSKTGAQKITSSQIIAAEVIFEKISTVTTSIDFFNYHEDNSGNTSINIQLDDSVFNILKKPDVPALIIQ